MWAYILSSASIHITLNALILLTFCISYPLMVVWMNLNVYSYCDILFHHRMRQSSPPRRKKKFHHLRDFFVEKKVIGINASWVSITSYLPSMLLCTRCLRRATSVRVLPWVVNPKSQIPNPKSQIPNPKSQIPAPFHPPKQTPHRPPLTISHSHMPLLLSTGAAPVPPHPPSAPPPSPPQAPPSTPGGLR